MLLAHHANVRMEIFCAERPSCHASFRHLIWKKRRRIRPLCVYEISPDLIPQNALSDLFLATRYTIVQALTEPIFIRSNAKLVALEASSFSLIVDTRNRHIIDEMDQILMSRYAHLLSESGCRMPV